MRLRMLRRLAGQGRPGRGGTPDWQQQQGDPPREASIEQPTA
jgi:hypothetical protein